MNFNEANTVEQMIIEALSPRGIDSGGALVLREDPPGWGDSLGGELRPAKWEFVRATDVPRGPSDVMVERGLHRHLR